MTLAAKPRVVRQGRVPFEPTWRAMQAFTQQRDANTQDEIWLIEHDPVFTLGLAGDAEHVLDAGGIPVVKTDRGGQATYHGPGQLVIYLLLDVRRLGFGVKELVRRVEQSIIEVAARHGVAAYRLPGMPGVYVANPARANDTQSQVMQPSASMKLAALGLKVARHCTYHGLAVNVAGDLAPFSRINPCGYPGLAVTSLAQLNVSASMERIGTELAEQLVNTLIPD